MLLKFERSIETKLESGKESQILGETTEWTSFHFHLQRVINCKPNDSQMNGVQSKIFWELSKTDSVEVFEKNKTSQFNLSHKQQ